MKTLLNSVFLIYFGSIHVLISHLHDLYLDKFQKYTFWNINFQNYISRLIIEKIGKIDKICNSFVQNIVVPW